MRYRPRQGELTNVQQKQEGGPGASNKSARIDGCHVVQPSADLYEARTARLSTPRAVPEHSIRKAKARSSLSDLNATKA